MLQQSIHLGKVSQDLAQRFDADKSLTINHLIEALLQNDLKVYVSGGAVRDWLIGQNANDIDLSMSGSVEQAAEVCLNLFEPEQLTVLHDFGLVKVQGPNASVDISIIRDIDDIGESLEQSVFKPRQIIDRDYLFRDFSINCFYYDCANAQVLNPIEQAFDDLQQKRLRVIMGERKIAVDQRICIRILQFMARGYRPTERTQALLQSRLDNDINTYPLFEKWLNIYINAQSHYFAPFCQLALQHVKDPQAAERLTAMLEKMRDTEFA